MQKLSVVLDTNVLVSSLWSGPPQRIIRLWRAQQLWLLLSDDILREYLDVLSRFVSLPDLHEWTATLTSPTRSIRVVPSERIAAIPDDPTDNKFLECAITGRADSIVSGDRHLLRLQTFRDVPILSPAQFLARSLE